MTTLSKRKILETNSISDQTALVEKLLPSGPRIIRHVIPAGKSIFTQIDKSDMDKAVYNWLRACGGFSEVLLSFAKSPFDWSAAVSKVTAFDTRDPRPIWTRTPKGRRDLAKEIAAVVNDPNRRIIFIQVKPDGIYVGEDKKGLFQARVIVTEDNKEQYPNTSIGQKAASIDWEPYIEFQASNRSRYTQYSTEKIPTV